MRRTLWCLAALVLLSAEKCVYGSMYPVALRGQRLQDSSLVGTWAHGPDSMVITGNSDSTYNATSWKDNSKTERSALALTRLGGKLLMQTRADDNLGRQFDVVVPVFTILRVDQIRPALVFRVMDGKWLEGLLKTEPNAVRYLPDYEDYYILTDPPPALRAFFGKYASDPKAWRTDSSVWTYVGPPPAP